MAMDINLVEKKATPSARPMQDAVVIHSDDDFSGFDSYFTMSEYSDSEENFFNNWLA